MERSTLSNDEIEQLQSSATISASKDFSEETDYNQQMPAPPLQSDLGKFQLSSIDVIDTIEHLLKGEVYDSSINPQTNAENGWVRKHNELVPGSGVGEVMAEISGTMNKNVILSYFDTDDACRMTKEIMGAFIKFLAISYTRLKIKKENRDRIVAIVETNVYAAICRAIEGKALTALTTSYRVVQQEQLNTQSEYMQRNGRGGFINSLFQRR